MYNTILFNQLWQDYANTITIAKDIHQLLADQGETVINDHIAFRTFNDPRININVLAQAFIEQGYQKKGDYDFPNKQLNAAHFEHEDPSAPKVFISELRIEKFSDTLQTLARECINQIPVGLEQTEKFLFSGVSWQPLNYQDYQCLLTESEYAAWLYAFGFRANHFTVNVNQLKHFEDIAAVNAFLKKQGIALNTAGGDIKGTPADLLVQSSTLAEKVTVDFSDGPHDIPACYYEFAKRYPLPNGELYQGFIAASADKLFESTDVKNKPD